MKIPFSRRTVPFFALLAMPLLTVAACGTSSSSAPNDGGSCTPGQQINCGCGNGGQGVQVCSATGGGYGTCACGDGGVVTEAGTDATISEDGATDAGGDSTTPLDGSGGSVCSISGAIYPAGTVNPSNPCQSCEPGASKTGWTTTNGVNTSCPAQEVCSGTCQSGCWIDGSFSASGATANSGCEACTPASSTTAWTSVTGAASCPSAEVCNGGSCASGCYISGAYYAAGTTMNGGCEVCTPSSSTSSWTDASNGKSCGGGQVCGSGVCGTQCDITGTGIVASGAVNPSNPCQSCQPGTSTTTWTSTDGVNTSCPTGDVCSGTTASCTPGCWISGAFVAANALNPSNPCQSCSPSGTGGTTAWTNTDGVNTTCPAAEVCNGQPASCVSGCYIAGSFYAANATANNGCEVCTPASSTSSWTDVTGAASCPGGEVCQAGSCVTGDDAGNDGGPGTLNWAENFGTTGSTQPAAVALDPSNGDVVVVGSFGGSINFGGGLVESHGDAAAGADIFVARYDKSGAYKWAKTFGNGQFNGATGVAVDASGNVVFGGELRGSLSLGGAALTLIGNADVFLAEFDSAGNYRWSESFGATGQYQQLDTVGVDASGNVLIAGVGTSINFGGGAETGYFVAKFTSGGGYTWSKGFSASCTEGSPTLAIDPQGDAILTGCFSGSVDFGGGTLTTGSYSAFLAKFDPTGAYVWANDYSPISDGNSSSSAASTGGLAVDADGNIFLQGGFFGAIDFGSGALSATDSSKGYVFLAKIAPTGSGIWSKVFVGSNTDGMYPQGVAVDGAGGPVVAIGLCGTVDYGGGSVSSGSNQACSGTTMSIASFNEGGGYRWAFAEGPPSSAGSAAIASPQGVAALGATVVIAGEFGGLGTTVDLPGKTLTAATSADMFLASFVP